MFWSLDIGICNLFDIWCLEFGISQIGFVEELQLGAALLQLAQLRDNIAKKLEVLCRDISEASPHADRYDIGIGAEGNIYPHYLCPYP